MPMHDAVVARVRGLLTRPKQELPRTIAEAGDFRSLLPYVLVLLSLGALAIFVSGGILGTYAEPQNLFGMRVGGGWYRAPGSALVSALEYVGLGVGGWWLLGRVLFILAPTFGARPDQAASFKVAAWTATPLWLTFALVLLDSIPYLHSLIGIGWLAGLIYGVMLGIWALPLLVGAPEAKAPSYILAAVGITLAAVVVAVMLFGFLHRMIFGATGSASLLH
jgi:hypothetical protein